MNNKAPRPSYFLTLCAVFGIIASVQVMTTPIWSSFLASSKWSIAWCDSTSPMFYWILLYAWSGTGLPVAYYLFRSELSKGYRWLIVSYVVFWLFAFVVASPQDRKDDGFLFILVILGFMVWSLVRYERRANQTMHSMTRSWRFSS